MMSFLNMSVSSSVVHPAVFLVLSWLIHVHSWTSAHLKSWTAQDVITPCSSHSCLTDPYSFYCGKTLKVVPSFPLSRPRREHMPGFSLRHGSPCHFTCPVPASMACPRPLSSSSFASTHVLDEESSSTGFLTMDFHHDIGERHRGTWCWNVATSMSCTCQFPLLMAPCQRALVAPCFWGPRLAWASAPTQIYLMLETARMALRRHFDLSTIHLKVPARLQRSREDFMARFSDNLADLCNNEPQCARGDSAARMVVVLPFLVIGDIAAIH